MTTDEFRKVLEAIPLPPPIIEMSLALGEAVRAGEFDAGSGDLEKLMDRAPLTLDGFLAKGRGAA